MTTARPDVAQQFSWDVTALLVSPCETEQHALREFFLASGWRLECARDAESGLSLLRGELMPVVICNDREWKFFLRAGAHLPRPPRVIVASHSSDEQLWTEVLDLGGYGVLATPVDEREAFRAISLAWHSWCRQWRTATTPGRRPHTECAGHPSVARAAATKSS